MSVLVLGAGGQVGRALLERGGSAVIGFDRAACDITDARSVARALATPGVLVVVNCAGYTAVDRAERERDLAFSINATGAEMVGRQAAALALPVIHLSSDYVYSGMGTGAYCEDEPTAPVNVYGASKAAGDALLILANPRHLVLRISWVFGVHGANFVRTMLRLAGEHREIRIVDDQIGGPTEARDIADAILTMALACRRSSFAAWGVYHFSGTPTTSWYGFAQAIFERTKGARPRLTPIPSGDYPTPARRPGNSRLDCTKIGRVFGISQPDWRTALSRILAVIDGVPV